MTATIERTTHAARQWTALATLVLIALLMATAQAQPIGGAVLACAASKASSPSSSAGAYERGTGGHGGGTAPVGVGPLDVYGGRYRPRNLANRVFLQKNEFQKWPYVEMRQT